MHAAAALGLLSVASIIHVQGLVRMRIIRRQYRRHVKAIKQLQSIHRMRITQRQYLQDVKDTSRQTMSQRRDKASIRIQAWVRRLLAVNQVRQVARQRRDETISQALAHRRLRFVVDLNWSANQQHHHHHHHHHSIPIQRNRVVAIAATNNHNLSSADEVRELTNQFNSLTQRIESTYQLIEENGDPKEKDELEKIKKILMEKRIDLLRNFVWDLSLTEDDEGDNGISFCLQFDVLYKSIELVNQLIHDTIDPKEKRELEAIEYGIQKNKMHLLRNLPWGWTQK